MIRNVEVILIYWGGRSNVRYSGAPLEGFYATATVSDWFATLRQYSTPTQTIGLGSFSPNDVYSFDNAPTGTIDWKIVGSQLKALITAGLVRSPTSNTYYAVHFPPWIDPIHENTCGNHGVFGYGPSNTWYLFGIIPDPAGRNCGDPADVFGTICSVASHELVEAVTDPDVGSGWKAAGTIGEIGDICAWQNGIIRGPNSISYTVQRIWSNYDNACVFTTQAPTPKAPTPAPTPAPTQAPTSGSSRPLLSYFGGRVIRNVEVIIIYWGGRSNVRYGGAQLEGFYAAVTVSDWFATLRQYSTPNQNIGLGSFNPNDVYSFDNAPTGILTWQQVATQLKALIAAGLVRPPTSNTYYALHFAPSTDPVNDPSSCGYHGVITYGPSGTYAPFAVLPDLVGRNCGDPTDVLGALSSLGSHELMESVIDPDIGPGWHADHGDPCNWNTGIILGSNSINYRVQKIWSNYDNSCVLSTKAPTVPTSLKLTPAPKAKPTFAPTPVRKPTKAPTKRWKK